MSYGDNFGKEEVCHRHQNITCGRLGGGDCAYAQCCIRQKELGLYCLFLIEMYGRVKWGLIYGGGTVGGWTVGGGSKTQGGTVGGSSKLRGGTVGGSSKTRLEAGT